MMDGYAEQRRLKRKHPDKKSLWTCFLLPATHVLCSPLQ